MRPNSKTCGNCGSTVFYRREANFDGHAKSALPVGWLSSAKCIVRVCGGCGLIQWFATPETMDGVKEKFERES
jgi:hypothetical protein